MTKYKTMDGNEACARMAYLFTEVAGIYPITPSSPMAELIDEWSNAGKKNIFNDQVKVVEMQSEAGAAGFIHGVLQSGCLATTFTASQGLLLMIPNLYKMAGELLPGVIHVAARSISTHALSILGDHQDIYATRMTGVAILASSNVQQAMDLSAVAHLSAIDGSIPFLHFFDGFRTSHELQKINLLGKNDIASLLNKKALQKFRGKSLSPNNKVIRGTTHNEDIYFQAAEVRNKNYEVIPDIVVKYMEQLGAKTGRNYQPFSYYGDESATDIIVAMGSVCETIKETIDELVKQGEKVGLIEVHLYRPFSSKYFLKVLPETVTKIAVLDRTKEPGSSGEPLYLDVVSVFNQKAKQPFIIGGRYGLSSKNTTPTDVKSVYDFLRSDNNWHGFTVSIEDDVTNLSIPLSNFMLKRDNVKEFLIYGYASDGMVSCSKDIIRIMGDYTDSYVQGYFQYDSKKSGGVTRSHIRLSNEPIRSTYYINSPDLVVCAKEAFLGRYDMLSNIKDNGAFLFVSSMSANEVIGQLSDGIKKLLSERNIKFYLIDAYKLANENGLKNKISMIIEACIFKITDLMSYKKVTSIIEENIVNNFGHKGSNIVESNIKAMQGVNKYLVEIEIEQQWKQLELDKESEYIIEDKLNDPIFSKMENLKGNELPVSAFCDSKDGSYICGTSKYEKRAIAENVPVWIPENCIQCNQCSFVCPHAVVRPFLLNKEEYENAPAIIKENAIDAVGSDYKFYVGISNLDCTGCGVCANTCPGKNGQKALVMKPYEEVSPDNAFEYLIQNVSIKEEQIKPTVKNSQFQRPLFEYSGACAGCGETPYLRLLTQLFGNKLVIANATGCSSIYGASMPSMPYSVPWANSLFEDNAEFGYGMAIAYATIRNRIKDIIMTKLNEVDEKTKGLLQQWLDNYDNDIITKEIYEQLDYNKILELKELKEFIPTRSIWLVGGDGWAYDIGFGGIDHVLASNDNVNILVLDSQVYSNTGGQSSKASEKGSVAKFTTSGKKTMSKDLARIAMTYPNVYVAQVSMGANMNQTLKAFIEAEQHQGPSIIIAYSTCILHGIKKGMEFSMEQQKRATECGYFPIFRYDPTSDKFTLDYKEPDFNKFYDFLNSENRFSMLERADQEKAQKLFKEAELGAMKKFKYYQSLEKKD